LSSQAARKRERPSEHSGNVLSRDVLQRGACRRGRRHARTPHGAGFSMRVKTTQSASARAPAPASQSTNASPRGAVNVRHQIRLFIPYDMRREARGVEKMPTRTEKEGWHIRQRRMVLIPTNRPEPNHNRVALARRRRQVPQPLAEKNHQRERIWYLGIRKKW